MCVFAVIMKILVVFSYLIQLSKSQLTAKSSPTLDPMDEKIFQLNVDEMVRKYVRPPNKKVPPPPPRHPPDVIDNQMDLKMPEDMTMEKLKKRRLMLETEMILKGNYSGIPNFAKNEDDIDVPTRRFDSLNKGDSVVRSRREYYWSLLELNKKPIAKERTLDLMVHFIYVTRYNLPQSQRLRNKYRGSTLYKIGYCFNVLRRLKIEQMIIYSTMRILMYDYVNLSPHIKLYQKIVNLDVDINDMIKFINALNKRRIEEIDAKYGWQEGLLHI